MTPMLLTKKKYESDEKNAGLKVSDLKTCSLSCSLVYEGQEWEFMREGKLIFVMPWSTIFGVCESWCTDCYAYTLQDLRRLWVQARTSFKCSLRAKWYEAHVLFQWTCITLKPSKKLRCIQYIIIHLTFRVNKVGHLRPINRLLFKSTIADLCLTSAGIQKTIAVLRCSNCCMWLKWYPWFEFMVVIFVSYCLNKLYPFVNRYW